MNAPSSITRHVKGSGLGLRRELLGPLKEFRGNESEIGFLEVAPENWMGIGGSLGKKFRAYTERFEFVTHGLSLSIGSPAPLDTDFVGDIRKFLDTHGIADYTEHLTYCSDDGHLYDLMPIPFTESAAAHVAKRVRQVQDILGRRIALENASYYAAPGQEMSELDFIKLVIEKSDCDMLLDVNNIWVNSINHRYSPGEFLQSLPLDRVRYIHVAGHYVEAEDLRVDTHGSEVIDPVWALLAQAYELLGPVPTLLERDFNIPPVAVLLAELARIRKLQAEFATSGSRHAA